MEFSYSITELNFRDLLWLILKLCDKLPDNFSIYIVHDELKDKQFELELSWVSKDTNGRHQLVPKDIAFEAENQAKQALADIEDSDDGDM